ncbi:DsbA family protein [Candidatus Shapirobacteria bacterium]|nr:DsbA family protein [Candidatus Shapirobacteria bacterium]
MKKTLEISQSAVMFVGLLLVVAVGFTGYLYGKVTSLEKGGTAPTAQQQAAQPAQANVTQDQVKALFDGKNISFGNKDSKVLFIEFSDPSCPYCHIAGGKNAALNKQAGAQFMLKEDGGTYVAPVLEMKKLVDEGKAGFVWLYANGHGAGESATRALYCAHEKGKFWEASDKLMNADGYALMNTKMEKDANGRALENAGNRQLLVDFLKPVVDAGFMKDCLGGDKFKDRLTSDMQIASQFGFEGTPSFFVNTKKFGGAYSWTDIKPTVDAEL